METTTEQAAEGSALVQVLAAVLDRLVRANGPLALADPGQVTKFHALKAPGIRVQQYLERIQKYSSCSNECFVFALIYIDRLIQRNNFLLTELNVHRVVITAILLAAKFFDDAYYNNAYYAKVGGVLVSEMNGLEVDFLFRINFSLHVTPDLFAKYRAELVSHAAGIGVTLPPSVASHMAQSIHSHTNNTTSHTRVSSGPYPVHQGQAQDPTYFATKQISFITPSPPVPMPATYPSDSSGSGSDQSMSFHPSSHAGTHPLPQGCSPRFNNASTMMPVGTLGSVDVGDQFVVIDNVAYPLHAGTAHVSHGAVGDGKQQGAAGTYEYPPPSYMGAKSEPTTAVTVTPHFVG